MNIQYLKIFIVSITCLIGQISFGQEVAISEKLNIRNYFSYDLVGKINNRILVYRDKGFSKEIDVFNMEMEHTQYSEFHFEKKKSDVYTLIGMDSVFHVLYGYLEKDSLILRMREYDHLVRLQDSTTLMKIYKKDIKRRFSYSVSKDKTKILLMSKNQDNDYITLVYDYYQKEITSKNILSFNQKFNKGFDNTLITNNGEIILVKKQENLKGEALSFFIVKTKELSDIEVTLSFDQKFFNNYHVDYDNENKNLIICGNYSEKSGKESSGFYIFKKPINDIYAAEIPKFIPFQARLSDELLQGKKRSKKRILDNLLVKDLIFRNDGGFILVSEIIKEFSRRSPYNSAYSSGSSGPYSRRGWVDYYNDDIVLNNFDDDLNTDWTKVLYKKQFSQDDEAIYSSFFIMKTPSRLRFIYNDEIKNNNTVSEYLLDPVGKIARNSLLSTEYQNMRLRFKDAIQLSSNSILVPSEKNYDLNLVKITY